MTTTYKNKDTETHINEPDAQTEHFETLKRYIVFYTEENPTVLMAAVLLDLEQLGWDTVSSPLPAPGSPLGDGGQLALVLYVQVPVRVV